MNLNSGVGNGAAIQERMSVIACDRRLGRSELRRHDWGGNGAGLSAPFFGPTLLGNMIGGISLVAIINHGSIASEIADSDNQRERGPERLFGRNEVDS